MNLVVLMGRLTRDVEVKQNGDSVIARFGVAVSREFKNKDGNYDADFLNCVAFGKTADFVSKYFHKGSKILITGRLQTGSYTNREGQKVYTTDIIVDKANFVENKDSSTSQGSAPQNNVADEFVNVPEGITEELPFN